MKKKIFVSLALILTISFISQLYAQETIEHTKQRTKSNNTNEKLSAQSSSVCTGKIRCTDGTCTINFNQEIVSPRDAASGLPTGKRMHKPFVITMELDKSSALLSRESPTKQAAGKVSMSELSVTMAIKGRTTKLPVVNNQFTLPSDGIDDDCDLVVSWSWGESNTGTSKNYQATFNLTVDKGEYMASKHTKTGHVTLMK